MEANVSRVTTEDWVAVSDLIGRYCWTTDLGEADEWAALWTSDGSFSGIAPEPVVGTEALKQIPTSAITNYGGRMRHVSANLNCTYVGGDRNTVRARFYNCVSVWEDIHRPFCLARCEMILVRVGADWKIKSNAAQLLIPGGDFK
jgi:hypothetical protein